jgi:hypothetical protein
MPLDDVALRLQSLVDRLIRRLRLGRAPARGGRRLLIVQIDGLSRSVLEQALAEGRMPFLRRLLRGRGYRLQPMSVGLPTSTPAFQLAAMYGVRPDIPGFHFHDKRRRADVYFPRGGDAALVEATQAAGRRGILTHGSAYGCVFTGGAENSLFSLARLKRPTGRGLVRAVSAFVVLAWVVVKAGVLTAVELGRALIRLVADPVSTTTRRWKWLVIKLGISVWVRELFTLVVSRDLYAGVPAIYVNYLDYDVLAHAFGPRHPSAIRALRRVDRSLQRLARVCRRVPEHRYDVYVLSDHGQATCTPYPALSGGVPVERHLMTEFLAPAHLREVTPARPHRRRLASGIKAVRSGRAAGLFQRFVNYLENDFPWLLRELPEARESDDVRIIAAGPNAFVYFLERDGPVDIEWIDERAPGLADELSRRGGIGFVLARSGVGPLCLWRGKRYRLDELPTGPFAGRDDVPLIVDGIRDLMAMPSAGDLVLYGIGAPEGDVSYIPEIGAHAGPSVDELHTFVVAPPGVILPSPVTHPLQLYPHFLAYQEVTAEPA